MPSNASAADRIVTTPCSIDHVDANTPVASSANGTSSAPNALASTSGIRSMNSGAWTVTIAVDTMIAGHTSHGLNSRLSKMASTAFASTQITGNTRRPRTIQSWNAIINATNPNTPATTGQSR